MLPFGHAALLTMDEWDWQRTLISTDRPILDHSTRERVMRYQGGGVIVNLVAA
jgi:hypothetical protein